MAASTSTVALLGVDTATGDAAVAVTRADGILFEGWADPGPDGRPRHSSALLGLVAEAVAAAGGWEAVGAIAVGVGPGTFTGLRVGVATARALAQARGLPLVAVGSLEALARGIPAGGDRPRLALLDARRGEVFGLLLGDGDEVVWPAFVAPPGDLAARIAELDSRPLAGGDGSLRFRQELEAAGAEVPPDADPMHRMAARNVCALAAGAERVGPEQVRPIYLRRPDAELWREQQRGGHGPGR